MRTTGVTATATAVTLLLACVISSDATANNRFVSNARIAAAASDHRNWTRGGSCLIFVRLVLSEATRGRLVLPSTRIHGYNGAFRAAGGHTVSTAKAARGDIIQIVPSNGRDGRGDLMPLHTAVILRNRGGGSFDVVDSNFTVDPRARDRVKHHTWNAVGWAARRHRTSGLTGRLTIWRLGTIGRRGTPEPRRRRKPSSDGERRAGAGPQPVDTAPSGARTRRGTDFDGDGRDDVLWYGPGGAYDTLHYGTSTRGDFRIAPVEVSGTYTPVAGDFDGDGRSDVLWYGPGGSHDTLWFGSATRGSFAQVAATVTGTYVPLAGDFDGDGRSDVLWYGPGSAYDTLHYGTGTRGEFRIAPIDVSGTYDPAVGDFDGDGRDDILWYGPGTAYDTLHYGTATGFAIAPVEVRGTYDPVVGDFDGGGRDDILWYGPGAAYDTLHLGRSTRGQFETAPVEVSGTYTPLTGDFDGDGRDDAYWYGPGDAHDALWYGSPTPGSFGQVAANVTGTYAPVR